MKENIENDLSEKRKKEIENYTKHLLTKEDLKKEFLDIKLPLVKVTLGLIVIIIILITGLYFK